MADPLQVPVRSTEPRGEFPQHTDQPRPQRTAAEAKAYAQRRLDDWRRSHGQRH